MQKVPTEIAIKDVERFLDFKKIGTSKRDSSRDDIDILVESIKDGSLTITDDCHLEYALQFPIEDDAGNIHTEKIVMKPRLRQYEVEQATKGVAIAKNPMEIIKAYISALSGKPKGIISKLETTDYKVLSAVVGFFI